MRLVRFGLRAVFSRAIWPVTPRKRLSGYPRNLATGFARSGPMVSTPENTSSTASPRSFVEEPMSTATIAAVPTPRRTSAAISRRRVGPVVSMAESRIAASGGTRPARTAGRRADANVTAIPTMRVTNTVLPVSRSPRCGTSVPSALRRSARPFESSTPKRRPSVEPMTPTPTASSMSVVWTCLREAPIARSRAFSRWRCAAVIENTL